MGFFLSFFFFRNKLKKIERSFFIRVLVFEKIEIGKLRYSLVKLNMDETRYIYIFLISLLFYNKLTPMVFFIFAFVKGEFTVFTVKLYIFYIYSNFIARTRISSLFHGK